MRRLSLKSVLIAAAVTSLSADGAHAATITRTFDFKASNFWTSFGPMSPPADPLIGSVTVTFDTDQTVTNVTSGITLHSVNVALGSPIAFSFDQMTRRMSIGGLAGESRGVTAGTDDFALIIRNADLLTASYIAVLHTVQSDPPAFSIFRSTTGEVTASAVPEPTSWALAVVGFAALGTVLRRRAAQPRLA